MSPASISTCRWYSSWLISSAVRALPSCSAAIHTSAASSTIFLPIAWTPASSSATVPDPCGRVAALSVNSAYSWSKVFTKVKVTGRLFCYLPPPTARIADRDHHSHVRTDLALLVKIITCRMWDQAGACDRPAAAPTVEVAMTDLRRTRGPAPLASTDRLGVRPGLRYCRAARGCSRGPRAPEDGSARCCPSVWGCGVPSRTYLF